VYGRGAGMEPGLGHARQALDTKLHPARLYCQRLLSLCDLAQSLDVVVTSVYFKKLQGSVKRLTFRETSFRFCKDFVSKLSLLGFGSLGILEPLVLRKPFPSQAQTFLC
jgi:hypothetical protein